jgi:hypothetical protein
VEESPSRLVIRLADSVDVRKFNIRTMVDAVQEYVWKKANMLLEESKQQLPIAELIPDEKEMQPDRDNKKEEEDRMRNAWALEGQGEGPGQGERPDGIELLPLATPSTQQPENGKPSPIVDHIETFVSRCQAGRYMGLYRIAAKDAWGLASTTGHLAPMAYCISHKVENFQALQSAYPQKGTWFVTPAHENGVCLFMGPSGGGQDGQGDKFPVFLKCGSAKESLHGREAQFRILNESNVEIGPSTTITLKYLENDTWGPSSHFRLADLPNAFYIHVSVKLSSIEEYYKASGVTVTQPGTVVEMDVVQTPFAKKPQTSSCLFRFSCSWCFFCSLCSLSFVIIFAGLNSPCPANSNPCKKEFVTSRDCVYWSNNPSDSGSGVQRYTLSTVSSAKECANLMVEKTPDGTSINTAGNISIYNTPALPRGCGVTRGGRGKLSLFFNAFPENGNAGADCSGLSQCVCCHRKKSKCEFERERRERNCETDSGTGVEKCKK